MIKRVIRYIYAQYRSFYLLSCFMSPRADILRGWRRWRWLALQRKKGREIEPSLRIQGYVKSINTSLFLGKACQIDIGCILWLGSVSAHIKIGDNCYIGPYTFLGTYDHTLAIERNVMIGAHCYIITDNHRTDNKILPYREQGYVGADLRLEENVWIGCHVTILPGITIGRGAVIGAGAVVTKDVPPGETWAGVPARCIKPCMPNPME